mmetsp:Transcript_89671/g.231435  ORF Transcript_89671/g.231435 Transcript_89671/m.231435 type:complete len:450 (-) Transcript_89671:6-1355(-)
MWCRLWAAVAFLAAAVLKAGVVRPDVVPDVVPDVFNASDIDDGLSLIQTSFTLHEGSSRAATSPPKAAARTAALAESPRAPLASGYPTQVPPTKQPSLTFRCHQFLLRGDLRLTLPIYLLLAWCMWSWAMVYLLRPLLLYTVPRSQASPGRGADSIFNTEEPVKAQPAPAPGEVGDARSDETEVQHLRRIDARVACLAGPGGAIVMVILVCLYLWGLHGRLMFVHIPKNGGTGIEYSGLRHQINWANEDMSLTVHSAMSDGSVCGSYHVPPYMWEESLPQWRKWMSPYFGAELFCVTRHPYERAVSEYTYLLSSQVDWSMDYVKKYENGLGDYPSCTKQGLNHFVQTTMHLLLANSTYIDDCHHVPQANYIWDPSGRQWCTNILRLDDLQTQFDQLMARHNYLVRLVPEHTNEANACTNIGTKDLDSQSRALLDKVYAEDFARLGYEPM